ncbi:DUF3093 domain-containing protein [Antrihabitans spumae]|uniref:DUF3093 domain-containing protein n=1 Tax=Antrihabitans spumae TaxID=3373370 RepID=A0ABW7JHS5_9NOCA
MSKQPQPAARAHNGETRPSYSERLWVPVWWWPIAVAVTMLLAAEIHMGAPGIRAWLPYLVLLPLPIWVLLWLSRLRVEVTTDADDGRELRIGRAHLPVEVISRAAVVPGTAKSAALGRQLDPAAYVQHRPWVKPMVVVVLDDADDPTPYWLISTRHPDRVLAALGLGTSSEPEHDKT